MKNRGETEDMTLSDMACSSTEEDTASANTSGFVRVAEGKLTKTKISTIIGKMQDCLFCYLSLICLELSFKQLVQTTLPGHPLLPICAPVNCQRLLASPLGSFNMRA